MLTVRLPAGLAQARRYAIDVVLREFLGLDFQMMDGAAPGAVRIEAEGKSLDVADVFFAEETGHWLQQSPGGLDKPLVCKAQSALGLPDDLPVAFASTPAPDLIVADRDHIRLAIDVFGTAFFLLTRYEEATCAARDRHGRVPLHALAPFQRDNVHRPLVDEHVELLWALMTKLWPGLRRRKRQFRMVLTHDVDSPFCYAFAGARHLVRRMAGDVLRRRSARLALRTAFDWCSVKTGDTARDPYNQFDWMMAQSERHGLTAAFYFICSNGAHPLDCDYRIDHPLMGDLMRRMASRGHEIGLHGGYQSGFDGALLRDEFRRLRDMCERHHVDQSAWGGRQHYLRWQTPQTIRHWDDAGLAYDSTLSFPERAGFRCGTCHEFPAFDLGAQQPLRVRERPLIVMECSVTDPDYMGLGEGAAALQAILSLKHTCKRLDGDFVLLWHNSRLATPAQRELYRAVLDA